MPTSSREDFVNGLVAGVLLPPLLPYCLSAVSLDPKYRKILARPAGLEPATP